MSLTINSQNFRLFQNKKGNINKFMYLLKKMSVNDYSVNDYSVNFQNNLPITKKAFLWAICNRIDLIENLPRDKIGEDNCKNFYDWSIEIDSLDYVKILYNLVYNFTHRNYCYASVIGCFNISDFLISKGIFNTKNESIKFYNRSNKFSKIIVNAKFNYENFWINHYTSNIGYRINIIY